MKFTKHQQKIIKSILDGDVYDLYSYATHFNLTKKVQYDLEKVSYNFKESNMPKKYFFPSEIQISKQFIIPENKYNYGLETGKYLPELYIHKNLQVTFDYGIYAMKFRNKQYQMNFYLGIDIFKDFNKIMDFCMIWKYLKDELLILETSQEISEETLGLFFTEDYSFDKNSWEKDSDYSYINFDDFKCSDKYFIDENLYTISENQITICSDFIGKRIYSTSKLKTFVENKFKSYEEKNQNKSFALAIIAIVISILIALLSPLYNNIFNSTPNRQDEIIDILNEINSNSEQNKQEEINDQVRIINDKIDKIIEKNESIAKDNSTQNISQ